MSRRTAAWVLALALGALQAASFSPPFDAWWLQLAALGGLIVLMQRSGFQPTGLAFTFGMGWFAAGVYWVHVSMHRYGDMPWLLATLALLLFAAYLSLYPAGAIAAWRRLAPSRRTGSTDPAPLRAALGGAALFAGLWGAAELLRGWVLTGFPWLAIGYAHIDGPLAGYAPWAGVYGVCTAAAFVSAILAHAFAQPALRWHTRLTLSAIAFAVIAGGAMLRTLETTRETGDPVRVRLVQGNVAQQMKFDPAEALRTMRDYADLASDGHAQLTVLPETAWVVPWTATPPEIAQTVLATVARNDTMLALGMPLAQADSTATGAIGRYTNSVALLGPASLGQSGDAQVLGRYDKRHLVPFGEFVPTGFRWFVDLMKIPLGDFGRGGDAQAPLEVAGQRFAFNVCYEDLFGEELLSAIRRPDGASILVNVSNIGWFGDTRALPQHLAIARMRALETGRPMLRATNTGVTAAIDHRGRVIARLPAFERGAINVTVRGTQGLTPYVRAGNTIPWLLAVLLAGLGLTLRAADRRPR